VLLQSAAHGRRVPDKQSHRVRKGSPKIRIMVRCSSRSYRSQLRLEDTAGLAIEDLEKVVSAMASGINQQIHAATA
jgi:hypothetical protein